eukprot:1160122-Pelagomonas_calceolata.AAC.5
MDGVNGLPAHAVLCVHMRPGPCPGPWAVPGLEAHFEWCMSDVSVLLTHAHVFIRAHRVVPRPLGGARIGGATPLNQRYAFGVEL